MNCRIGITCGCLDSTRQWLGLETENGVTGWLRLADYTREDAEKIFLDLMTADD